MNIEPTLLRWLEAGNRLQTKLERVLYAFENDDAADKLWEDVKHTWRLRRAHKRMSKINTEYLEWSRGRLYWQLVDRIMGEKIQPLILHGRPVIISIAWDSTKQDFGVDADFDPFGLYEDWPDDVPRPGSYQFVISPYGPNEGYEQSVQDALDAMMNRKPSDLIDPISSTITSVGVRHAEGHELMADMLRKSMGEMTRRRTIAEPLVCPVCGGFPRPPWRGVCWHCDGVGRVPNHNQQLF